MSVFAIDRYTGDYYRAVEKLGRPTYFKWVKVVSPEDEAELVAYLLGEHTTYVITKGDGEALYDFGFNKLDKE